MSQDLGLSQIVDTPTRGTSILDLFFTNNPDFVKNFTIIDGVGDHDIVHVKTSLKPFRKKPVKRTIQLWTKVDEVKLLKETNDLTIMSPLKLPHQRLISLGSPPKLRN